MSAPAAPLSSGASSPTQDLHHPTAGGRAARLAAEMRQRWLRGERPGADEFLARHPELHDEPEAAIALIYEELELRRQLGAEEPDEALFARFPRLHSQLQLLLECDRLLAPGEDPPDYPTEGEALGGFRLLTELGRGARGRVFLATQPALADRPVVLKLTPRHGPEHLSLARLQHTHIVPLHWVEDRPDRNLLVLCLPYFGGATLADVLCTLADFPPPERTGRRLLEALNAASHPLPSGAPLAPAGPARRLLGRASYVEAVCWIGACLADALQYAHERGLVHLDLKPSNVLLTADGVPMLLDFHLAQAPLLQGGPPPEELGGSPPYMPREQHEAMQAVADGRDVPTAVDGRADLYALGVILHEALGGQVPVPGAAQPPLHRLHPEVSVGLSDVLVKCVAPEPPQRYRTAADLAADLRRHLTDQALRGVPNRSPAERWRKWRRRHPAAIKLAVLLLALLGTTATLSVFAGSYLRQREGEADYALQEGRRQWRERRHYVEAVTTLKHGLAIAEGLPLQGNLATQLRLELGAAREAREAAHRAALVEELHQLADGLRLLCGEETTTGSFLPGLEALCREAWGRRAVIREALGGERDAAVNTDLLDLAILAADFRVRLAPPGQAAPARREALHLLDEAEVYGGTSAVLEHERRRHRQALGLSPSETSAEPAPRTAWEHYALGRSYLMAGDLERAGAELNGAVRLEPSGLWPNYYRGLCAYRQRRYEEAAQAFSVCVGAAAGNARCHYHRALARMALGHADEALADYDRALQLEPGLAPALLNRGMLHYGARRLDLAVADLQQALQRGAAPALAAYDLALVHLARHDRAAARTCLRQVLVADPHHEAARELLDRLGTDAAADW
jgi:serine/threonine protein kinase/tetratricopeptide (TPR) repeat protein